MYFKSKLSLYFMLTHIIFTGCGEKINTSLRYKYKAPSIIGNNNFTLTNPLNATNVPMIAVWHDASFSKQSLNEPFLRFAIWDDGRIIFARNPNIWSNDLLLSKLSHIALTNLIYKIIQTDIFDLPGHCYLVPDGPIYCLTISMNGNNQTLFWDEIKHDNYGININPKPHHLLFMKVWQEINEIVLESLPEKAYKINTRFKSTPKTWFRNEMIQSR